MLKKLKEIRDQYNTDNFESSLSQKFYTHLELKDLSVLERLKRIQCYMENAKAIEEEYLYD